MIVKVTFDSEHDLIMLFGNTMRKKWHKYFREYVKKHARALPLQAEKVEVCENAWIDRGFKWVHASEYQALLNSEVPHLAEDYSAYTFYSLPAVTEKVNKIIMGEKA